MICLRRVTARLPQRSTSLGTWEKAVSGNTYTSRCVPYSCNISWRLRSRGLLTYVGRMLARHDLICQFHRVRHVHQNLFFARVGSLLQSSKTLELDITLKQCFLHPYEKDGCVVLVSLVCWHTPDWSVGVHSKTKTVSQGKGLDTKKIRRNLWDSNKCCRYYCCLANQECCCVAKRTRNRDLEWKEARSTIHTVSHSRTTSLFYIRILRPWISVVEIWRFSHSRRFPFGTDYYSNGSNKFEQASSNLKQTDVSQFQRRFSHFLHMGLYPMIPHKKQNMMYYVCFKCWSRYTLNFPPVSPLHHTNHKIKANA